ncbi:GNAT family N-acetyltransferase [Marinibaculum pumilum]|uniref:GNAT family N-acetyltransferase n=1 Tax=Marinibaculum pumilum TaxID=1766165 RepID=A0ABV7KZU0_9PROT
MNMHVQPDTAVLRPARPADARALAKLIDIAGEGIPHHLWSGMAQPDESPLDVGAARARRDEGGFSWRHATVAESEGAVAGLMLGYPIEAPSAADRAAVPDLPAVIRPVVELEHEVPGSFYVNALAVLPGRRDAGLGYRLMAAAEARAKAAGLERLSIQVFSQNAGAVRLYRRLGYVEADSRPVLDHPCQPYYDGRVLLLVKAV